MSAQTLTPGDPSETPPSDPLPALSDTQPAKTKKGGAFWLSVMAVLVSVFISALDLTAVSTALPTIISDLKGGNDFTWVGSAYSLASTSVLPLTGCLADIFGRRPVMLGSVAFFVLGSALAGAAQSMNMLIAARSEASLLSLSLVFRF